jgi:hypothetical protein
MWPALIKEGWLFITLRGYTACGRETNLVFNGALEIRTANRTDQGLSHVQEFRSDWEWTKI